MMYRKATKQRVALVTLLAATATVVTLDFRENPGGPVRRAQDVAISVVAPLQDAVSDLLRPVGDFLSALSELPSLRSENETLRSEIEMLEERQRRIPEMVREHERALALLQEKDWVSGETLGARVIAVGPSNQESSRILNKGDSEGVRERMGVVAAEGLVGRIVWIGTRQSKVLLIIDHSHSVGARLTGSGETGVLTGRGAQNLRFELIDPDTPVEIGETVVTSGYDLGIYPAGIPIGRVVSVHAAKDGLTKNAFVHPFVDFSKLDLVRILLVTGEPEGKAPTG